jgi:hypothetical protein
MVDPSPTKVPSARCGAHLRTKSYSPARPVLSSTRCPTPIGIFNRAANSFIDTRCAVIDSPGFRSKRWGAPELETRPGCGRNLGSLNSSSSFTSRFRLTSFKWNCCSTRFRSMGRYAVGANSPDTPAAFAVTSQRSVRTQSGPPVNSSDSPGWRSSASRNI